MEDRISSLPDSIICHHILSLLPTKFAATTSILSKRWKPLWLSVPTLHFDDETFPNYASFFRFVSLIFLSRDIKLSLLSFHLKCSKASAHQSQDINRFVQAAAQRGIENLILKTSGFSFRLKLPLSIFNCRTLVVLRLEGFKVNDLSHVVVNFPLLKTLHLSYLIFKPVQYLLKILSGCPILEELQIKHLPPASLVLEKKIQYLPNLNRADISYFSSNANVLFTLICSVEVLRAELDTSYNHFPTFQNLTHMELIPKYKHCEMWQWVIEVLKRCPKLQNLIIYEDSKNGEEVVDNSMDPSTIPECLSTQLKTCLLIDFKYTERGLQFAEYIMQNSKVLNTMTIKSADTTLKCQILMLLAWRTKGLSTCKLLFD